MKNKTRLLRPSSLQGRDKENGFLNPDGRFSYLLFRGIHSRINQTKEMKTWRQITWINWLKTN